MVVWASGVGLGLCVCGWCIGFDVVCGLIRWVRRRIVGICEVVALLSAFRLVVSACLDCRCGARCGVYALLGVSGLCLVCCDSGEGVVFAWWFVCLTIAMSVSFADFVVLVY